MFAGLVEELGEIGEITEMSPGKRLAIVGPIVSQDVKLGDSICVNGCCLTVVMIAGDQLAFEVSPESLDRTGLGQLKVGSRVNLERSLAIGDRLGGHFVTGHIDAVGTIDEIETDNEWSTYWFRCPAQLTTQMASKGSIAVDGISLTLVAVESERFSVALIPHTLKVTTLGTKQVGDGVNLETDLLAKYVAKQLGAETASDG